MIDLEVFYKLLGVPAPPAKAAEPILDSTGTRGAPTTQPMPVVQGSLDARGLPGMPAIRLVTSAGELEQIIPDLLQAPLIGLDTETTGLDCISDRLRLVQLATDDSVVIVDCFQVDPLTLAPVLKQARRIAGQNLKFDLNFLARAGLPVPDGKRLFDTMLAAQLLGAGTLDGRLDKCGLGAVAERMLGVRLDKSLQRADWTGPLSSERIRYAATDASILLPLTGRLQAELAKAELDRVAQLEMRALPAVAWLERTGAPFDSDRWADLSDGATSRQVQLEQELTAMAGAVERPGRGRGPINWSSPQQVLSVLRARGHNINRTDEAALRQLVETDPLAKILLEYREASCKASTYGIEFLNHVHPTTGRIHPNYLQLGAQTGRMACKRPGLQQVPRDPAYRACFRPEGGRCLVKVDYSQIELRIVAEITGDPRMLEAYNRGEDLHAITAVRVLGRSDRELTPEDRQAAKALNFGLIYGMGAHSLREHAANDYGVVMTDEDAVRFRESFFSTYRGVRKWQLAQPRGQIETRTLAGRRRQEVESFWVKLNSPVQGTGADGLKAALALLWETRERCASAAPVLVVHDEIVLECPVEEAGAARAWLVESMMRGMSSFLRHVPVQVDAKIGANWSELK